MHVPREERVACSPPPLPLETLPPRDNLGWKLPHSLLPWAKTAIQATHSRRRGARRCHTLRAPQGIGSPPPPAPLPPAPGGTRVHRCAAGGCKATSHGRVWVMGKLRIPSSSPWLCMAPEDWRGGGATPLRITPTRTPSAIHPPDAGDKIVQNSAAGGEQHWGTQLGISDAIAIRLRPLLW